MRLPRRLLRHGRSGRGRSCQRDLHGLLAAEALVQQRVVKVIFERGYRVCGFRSFVELELCLAGHLGQPCFLRSIERQCFSATHRMK